MNKKAKSKYEIAVIHGDGIGPEVCQAAVSVLTATFSDREFLAFTEYEGGAGAFLKYGTALPDETLTAVRASDATLHGAVGDPSVLLPDGTEAGQDFSLHLRSNLDVYANVRHVKLYEGVSSRLKDKFAGDIDYAVVRENVEGLYASHGAGIVLRDHTASDTLLITREGTERIARYAFELARKRNGAPSDGRQRVTVCDKANVLRSYAFFRKVCTEVAKDYPEIELEYCMVDALTAHLITRPEHYDVIVAENIFGDIISDLGPATIGGMGLSPTAELGKGVGYFQAAHGSAPDIAGEGIANPTGTILSGAMMLEWLAEEHNDSRLQEGAIRLRSAVEGGLANGRILTRDLGGTSTTAEVTAYLREALKHTAKGNIG